MFPLSLNATAPGAVDEFEVVAAVGELRALRIGHDNTGHDPAWNLKVRDTEAPAVPRLARRSTMACAVAVCIFVC